MTILLLSCWLIFCDGDIIYQDNMDNLDDWIIIGNSYVDNVVNSEYCPSNICSYISEHTTIYKSFNISEYIDISVKYSIDIGGEEDIGCRRGSTSCDYFYVFYQCAYIMNTLQMYNSDRGPTIQADEVVSLENNCNDWDELIIYFHANVNDPREKAYIDELIIEGTVGNKDSIKKELVYVNKLDNVDTFQSEGDVVAYTDREYCVPNNCVQLNSISNVLISNIDISGYRNISIYYDVNISPLNYFDDTTQEFSVLVSCENNEFTTIKVYKTTDDIDPFISRYYVGERFDLSGEGCNNQASISIMFELNAIEKTVYIGNLHIFGTQSSQNITTNFKVSTTQFTTTSPIITTSNTVSSNNSIIVPSNSSSIDNSKEKGITFSLGMLFILGGLVLLICIIGIIYICTKLTYGYNSKLSELKESKDVIKTPQTYSQPSIHNNPVITDVIQTRGDESDELPKQPEIKVNNEITSGDTSMTISDDDIEIITSSPN